MQGSPVALAPPVDTRLPDRSFICSGARPDAGTRPRENQQRVGRGCCEANCEPAFSMARLCVLTWVEQPMEVNDEIAHMGVVNGLLRLRLPGRVSGGVVREHADDFHLVEILESSAIEIGQLAPEDEVKQLLLGAICHDSPSTDTVPGSQIGRNPRGSGQRAVSKVLDNACMPIAPR